MRFAFGPNLPARLLCAANSCPLPSLPRIQTLFPLLTGRLVKPIRFAARGFQKRVTTGDEQRHNGPVRTMSSTKREVCGGINPLVAGATIKKLKLKYRWRARRVIEP